MEFSTIWKVLGNGGAVGILTWFVTILFKAVIKLHDHIITILCEQRDTYRSQVEHANRRIADMAEIIKEQAEALHDATEVLDRVILKRSQQ